LGQNPIAALTMAFNTVLEEGPKWWFSAFGHFGGHPPPYAAEAPHSLAMAALAILIALCMAEAGPCRDRPFAMALTLTAVTYSVGLLASFAIAFTPPANPVITGVQGRYFLAPLALLVVATAVWMRPPSWLRAIRQTIFKVLMVCYGAAMLYGIERLHQLWHS
jgi:hypothetical protein